MRVGYSNKDYRVFDPIRKGRGGSVTRNLYEFAAELGIEHRSLAAMASRSKSFPEPILKHRFTGGKTSATYYSYAELKRWWKNREVKE